MLYRDRRSALLDSLKNELDIPFDVKGEQAGLHLSVTLPRGFRDHDITERALRHKLWLTPLSTSYMERPAPQGLVLGFSNVSVTEIPKAVKKMKEILHSKK